MTIPTASQGLAVAFRPQLRSRSAAPTRGTVPIRAGSRRAPARAGSRSASRFNPTGPPRPGSCVPRPAARLRLATRWRPATLTLRRLLRPPRGNAAPASGYAGRAPSGSRRNRRTTVEPIPPTVRPEDSPAPEYCRAPTSGRHADPSMPADAPAPSASGNHDATPRWTSAHLGSRSHALTCRRNPRGYTLASPSPDRTGGQITDRQPGADTEPPVSLRPLSLDLYDLIQSQFNDRNVGPTGLLDRQTRERLNVREIHRASPPGRRPRPGRGADAQAQLHRHRAHPARPAARGGGPRRPGARVTRHHRRARPRPGRPHRRLRRRGHLRPDPVHPARQEGARAGAARGALARPQLHRHRAHPARPGPRERGRRRAHPARLRRRLREDPQRGHPHALRPRRSPPGRTAGRLRRGQEVLEAARPVRPQPDQARRRRQARPGDRPRDRDRADHADPLPPHQEQPGAARRARRRQDRRRRGPGRADHQRRGPRAAARTSRSTRSTWPPWSPAPSTAASSRSASRR